MKSRFLTLLIVSLIIGSSIIWWATSRSNIVVSGSIVCGDKSMIYIDQLQSGVRKTIDSMELSKSGKFKFTIKNAPVTPMVYELRYDMERAPLLATRGDHIKVNSLARLALNYTVKGSEESELLRTFYQTYVQRSSDLNKIATRYASVQGTNEAAATEVAKEYNELYREIKQEQIKFIVTNKSTMSAVYALFQLLPGDSYIVSESSDMIYMKTVLDGISERYPKSPYVVLLGNKIEQIEARMKLLNSLSYSNYPELVMSDMFGKKIALSSLSGRVILVDFWSASAGNSNINNAELKELYSKYSNDLFEVYQVAIDSSKSTWINAVQAQKLPWISVSDLQGTGSQSLGLYNITSLPSNILINKDGDIVGRNLYGDELEKRVAAEIER